MMQDFNCKHWGRTNICCLQIDHLEWCDELNKFANQSENRLNFKNWLLVRALGSISKVFGPSSWG